MDVLETITGLLERWGYWIVFFGVMLENAGIPVPGETILLAAGFVASRGHLHLGVVMAVAATGAILGDNAGYWIGHRLGRAFLLKYGKWVLLTEKRFLSMEGFFHSHGDKTVLVARFITGFRVFTALFAGASHMPWRRFVVFNALGAVSWAVVMALLGYFFGRSLSLLERWINGAGIALAGLAVAAFVIYRIWHRVKEKKRAASSQSGPN